MVTINLPHWLTSEEIQLTASSGSLFDVLQFIIAQQPALNKYIFSGEGVDSAVKSTAIWLNGKEIPMELEVLKNTNVSDGDVLDIEPAIVGG